MGKCPHCGEVPFPVYNKEKKEVIWKNVFRIDWNAVIWTVIMLIIAYGYWSGLGEAKEVLTNPDNFCSPYCIKMQEKGFYNNTGYKTHIGGFLNEKAIEANLSEFNITG